jgi:hypothetical protein
MLLTLKMMCGNRQEPEPAGTEPARTRSAVRCRKWLSCPLKKRPTNLVGLDWSLGKRLSCRLVDCLKGGYSETSEAAALRLDNDEVNITDVGLREAASAASFSKA